MKSGSYRRSEEMTNKQTNKQTNKRREMEERNLVEQAEAEIITATKEIKNNRKEGRKEETVY